MQNGEPFAGRFATLDDDQRHRLAIDLANEVAFFPALNGLVTGTGPLKRGPKPKSAQAVFTAQIRQVLAGYRVTIPMWKNNMKTCADLIEFCELLARVTGTRGLRISWRTAEKVPEAGFSELS